LATLVLAVLWRQELTCALVERQLTAAPQLMAWYAQLAEQHAVGWVAVEVAVERGQRVVAQLEQRLAVQLTE
jgi:hypothetical protein